MNKNDDKAGKLVSLAIHKGRLHARQKEESFARYLSVMSFTQLIDEAAQIVDQLNKGTLNAETTLQTRILIKEFGCRLGRESKELSDTLLSMRNTLEQKLSELNALIYPS